MEDPINPWKVLSSQKIYENPWIDLVEHQVLNPSGGPGIYGVVRFKNLAIGILPVDDEGNIWLIGQYRFALGAFSWEIPEGGGPKSQHPLNNAKRELLEESGLVASRWQELARSHLSNSVTDELGIIYLASGLSQHAPSPEETEKLLVKKMPFHEAYRELLAGKITDSMSVIALLRLKILVMERPGFFTNPIVSR